MTAGPGRLEVRPLANLELRPEAGRTVWVAGSADPQCLIAAAGGGSATFRSGWYRITLRIVAVGGAIVSPTLYPDYGSGCSEEDRIALPDGEADGLIDALVLLPSDARMLRFDPTTNPASFVLSGFSIRRIGKFRAATLMAEAIARAKGEKDGFAGRFRVLYGVFRNAAKHGRRRAGELAYREYSRLTLASDGDYRAWLSKYDSPQLFAAETQAARVAALARRPLISIVVPVYNTSENWLRQCIESVLGQSYPHWELCIADDASPSPHVRKVLEQYAAADARIKVVFRQANGHISAASNSALEIATGEYCALLDHDDLLPAHALLEVAEAVVANPEWKIIFTDEDKVDEEGRRYAPYFKPDWNYDLFLSQNCISHFGVYATALLKDIGGFRLGMEGSQDWDLALRCLEALDCDGPVRGQVGHIPKVLYHWRAIPGSTALGVGEKNYAHTAAMAAIQSHLDRRAEGAVVHELEGQAGRFRVQYRVPAEPPRVSLIIPTRDKVELLECCIDSILTRSTYRNYEILIVDNGSEEPATLEYFEKIGQQPGVRVLPYPAPFNYSAINNFAVASASGSVLGFVNNDIEVITPGWLEEMLSHALRPDVGAVGAKLYYPDDTIQHAGVILGLGGIAGHLYAGMARQYPGQMGRALLAQEMSAVTAACMLVRREVFEAVGGFDEALRVAFNDVDLCLRIRKAGYRNLWTPFAELYHHESASRGYEDTPEKMKRFQGEIDLMRERWDGLLFRDPAYNVNLPLVNDGSLFAFPPREAGRP